MNGSASVDGVNAPPHGAELSMTQVESQFLGTRPSRNLSSKVAVVTGAGALGYFIGNGRAAAIMLAEAGASVVCADRDGAPAARTVELIEYLKLPGKAVSIVADVTREEDCKAVVELALSTFGRLDILVNNVGIHGSKGTSLTVDMAEWDAVLRVNVASMILMAKFAIPAMLDGTKDETRRVRGSIVNIASVNGIRGGSPDIFYPTTKGAIVNMTRAMAAHHGSSGIRVNCVCPGKKILAVHGTN